jgi:hypothetical protein
MLSEEQIRAERETIVKNQMSWQAQLNDAQAAAERIKDQILHAQLQVAMCQGHIQRLDWMLGKMQTPVELAAALNGQELVAA